MSESEQQLVKQAKEGDAESFALLIQSSRSKAYNIAFRYMKNEEDALDALQESYMKIFRALPGFKEESSFDTWVYRIVVNTCNDMLRKQQRSRQNISLCRKDDNDADCTIDLPDTADSPETILEKKELMETLISCLHRLPHEQREAVMLRDIHGFSYEEIAGILRCSDGTIKSRISRGRAGLRKLLLEQGTCRL